MRSDEASLEDERRVDRDLEREPIIATPNRVPRPRFVKACDCPECTGLRVLAAGVVQPPVKTGGSR